MQVKQVRTMPFGDYPHRSSARLLFAILGVASLLAACGNDRPTWGELDRACRERVTAEKLRMEEITAKLAPLIVRKTFDTTIVLPTERIADFVAYPVWEMARIKETLDSLYLLRHSSNVPSVESVRPIYADLGRRLDSIGAVNARGLEQVDELRARFRITELMAPLSVPLPDTDIVSR